MEKDYIRGNIDNIVKRKKAAQLPGVFLPTEDGGQQLSEYYNGWGTKSRQVNIQQKSLQGLG